MLTFLPGSAELEKNTPHHCVMEQGILSAALAAVGCPGIVAQRQCFRQGADTCIYTIFCVDRRSLVRLSAWQPRELTSALSQK